MVAMRLSRLLAVCLALAALIAAPALASVPTAINYQGFLTDAGGPVTGTVSVTFELYDAAAGGALLWNETYGSVTVTNGVFNVLLGTGGSPLDETVFDGSDRYLAVTVGGDLLSPRKRLVSVPYAIQSGTAGVARSVAVPADLSGAVVAPNALVTADNSSTGPGIVTSSAGGNALTAETTTTTGGTAGVKGTASAATGTVYGVLGVTNSSNGIGVYGQNLAISGFNIGVKGTSVSGVGLVGESQNNTAIGGTALGTTGLTSGVFGQSNSATGRGVTGYAYDPTGVNYGVYGSTESASGYAGYFVGNVSVTGDLSAGGTKPFIQPDARDPSKEIVYVASEGPEAMVFQRGTATLHDGRAVIELPGHFRIVAAREGLQVQLTPHSIDTYGLAAVERSRERVVVRELKGGHGNFSFDYTVTDVRAGFENHRPVVENTHFRPLPGETAGEFEKRFAADTPANRALRAMMAANGLMTADGKLNPDTLKRLGWQVAKGHDKPIAPGHALAQGRPAPHQPGATP